MGRPNVNVVVGGPKNPSEQIYKTVILKSNLPFAAQIGEPNTKYVIRFNYDLGGATVEMPENCILEFDGGSLKNGTVIGQDTVFINVGDVEIWGANLERQGTWSEALGGGGIPDKEYDPEHHSGLGRKTLNLKGESNILTQEDFDQENTVYVISYDFDLNGATVEIPEGSVLEFEGGSLDNGILTSSLNGITLLNPPSDLYEKVDCRDLYVLNETHLSLADISDTYDTFGKDNLLKQDAVDQIVTTSHYYCIAGMDKLIFRCPAGVMDTDISHNRQVPYIRYVFYNRDFECLGELPWGTRDGSNVFTDIPEDAVYVIVAFSKTGTWSKTLKDEYVLSHINLNFLDNPKIFANNDFKDLPESLSLSMYRVSASSINCYSYSNPEADDRYIYTTYKIGNITKESIFIPYSVLKHYDCIEVRGHGAGATYTFIDDDQSTEERPYSNMLVYFLKKTPLEQEEVIEYSDYYKWRHSINQSQNVNLLIPPDCKCIYIPKADQYSGSLWRCDPLSITLRKKSSYNYEDIDSKLSTHSNRDVNIAEIKFLHWNFGADNIGGYLNENYLDNTLVEKRRTAFNAFFNKFNSTHNLLFNEHNYWLTSDKSVKIDTLSSTYIYHAKRIFPQYGYQSLATYVKNNLLDYRIGYFNCLKNLSVHGQRFTKYSYGYILLRYAVAGLELYVMQTHLPLFTYVEGGAYTDPDSVKALYREIVSIMSQYSNAIVVGDFNDYGLHNQNTMSGNRYANLEAVFEEAGWHIANKDFAQEETIGNENSTHDYAKGWETARYNSFDYCVWKSTYLTLTDFRIRRDAIIENSGYDENEEALENINGTYYGNIAYCNRRLSDHWPIEFTIKYNGNYNITPHNEGNERYNFSKKKIEWHDGDKWVDPVADFNDIVNISNLKDAMYIHNGRVISLNSPTNNFISNLAEVVMDDVITEAKIRFVIPKDDVEGVTVPMTLITIRPNEYDPNSQFMGGGSNLDCLQVGFYKRNLDYGIVTNGTWDKTWVMYSGIVFPEGATELEITVGFRITDDNTIEFTLPDGTTTSRTLNGIKSHCGRYFRFSQYVGSCPTTLSEKYVFPITGIYCKDESDNELKDNFKRGDGQLGAALTGQVYKVYNYLTPKDPFIV